MPVQGPIASYGSQLPSRGGGPSYRPWYNYNMGDLRNQFYESPETLFGDAYDRSRRAGGPVEEAFMSQTLTPGALYGAASTAASGVASELFAPGGEIARLISGARGQAIGSGFAPGDSIGEENNILRAGTQRVASTFAQQAGALEGQRFNALTGAFGQSREEQLRLLEDLFSGRANVLQYGMARDVNEDNGFLGLGIF